MSDDLKKRLRDTPNWMREGFQDWKDNVRTYDRAPFEAADRIEELEKRNASLEVKLSESEALLAKAVDALGEAIYLLDPDEEDIAKETGLHRIVTTYAELTGGPKNGNE